MTTETSSQREQRIQAWIDRPTSHETVLHNDPRGREQVEFFIQTTGRSVTYVRAAVGPAPGRHQMRAVIATATSAGWSTDRSEAAAVIRAAIRAGQEVRCKRYRYEAQPGPIQVRYVRP